MIKSFGDRRTEELFVDGFAKRIPPDVARRALNKLALLNAATDVEQLRSPPGNRLHMLKGDRAGQYSISVNDQWRICFSFEDGRADDVELTDYH